MVRHTFYRRDLRHCIYLVNDWFTQIRSRSKQNPPIGCILCFNWSVGYPEHEFCGSYLTSDSNDVGVRALMHIRLIDYDRLACWRGHESAHIKSAKAPNKTPVVISITLAIAQTLTVATPPV